MADDSIKLDTNASQLIAILGEVGEKQIPFATAKAINDVAFMGMRAAKSELAQSLTNRNRFSQTGIQVNKADKRQWPNVQAEVGIEERRSYLIDHVTGGKRSGGRHGRAVLNDTSLRNPRGRVPKGKRPAAFIRKARKQGEGGRTPGSKNGVHRKPLPFLIFSGKFGNEVLVRRLGPARYPLEIIYAFTKNVAIKRQFQMDLAVQEQVQGNYERAFGIALQKALRTAKTKSQRRASRSRGVTIDSGR